MLKIIGYLIVIITIYGALFTNDKSVKPETTLTQKEKQQKETEIIECHKTLKYTQMENLKYVGALKKYMVNYNIENQFEKGKLSLTIKLSSYTPKEKTKDIIKGMNIVIEKGFENYGCNPQILDIWWE